MGSHSATCHPTEVRIPPLPSAEAGTRFSDPGGMQGWVDLCYVKATGRELNPRPVNRKSNTLPPSHHATQTNCCLNTRWIAQFYLPLVHLIHKYNESYNTCHYSYSHRTSPTILCFRSAVAQSTLAAGYMPRRSPISLLTGLDVQ